MAKNSSPIYNFPNSQALSTHYVFYSSLAQETDKEHQKLYKDVRTLLNKYEKEKLKRTNILSTLNAMAENEARKEELFLQQRLENPNIKIDYTSINGLKEVLDNFNSTLSIKEVYERNLKRIEKLKTAGVDVSYFSSKYFNTYIDNHPDYLDNIIKDIIMKWKNKGKKGDLTILIQETISEHLLKIMKEVLKEMFESKAFQNLKQETNDYQLLLDELKLETSSLSSQFLSNLKHAWGLDELEANAVKLISSVQGLKNKSKKLQSALSKNKIKLHDDKNLRGDTLELIENYIVNTVGKSDIVTSYHSGPIKMKADNIYIYGEVDQSIIKEIDNVINELKLQAIDRVNFVEKMRLINEKIKKTATNSNSWIVYSSAKNYKLGGAFGVDGMFHGGSTVKAEKIGTIIGNLEKIGALYQTIPGAIQGDNENYKEKIKNSLAEDLAYLLFDDVSIESSENTNDSQALHVFNLNGIMVPLSYLLYHLGEVISKSWKRMIEVITIEVNVPSQILFPSKNDIKGDIGKLWDDQRSDAINNSTIAVNFFNDFENIMRQVAGENL